MNLVGGLILFSIGANLVVLALHRLAFGRANIASPYGIFLLVAMLGFDTYAIRILGTVWRTGKRGWYELLCGSMAFSAWVLCIWSPHGVPGETRWFHAEVTTFVALGLFVHYRLYHKRWAKRMDPSPRIDPGGIPVAYRGIPGGIPGGHTGDSGAVEKVGLGLH